MTTVEAVKINLSQFGGLFKREPAVMPDQELLSLDFLLHRAAAIERAGHRVFFNAEDWSHEDLVRLHDKVVSEMVKRGFRHTIDDASLAKAAAEQPPAEDLADEIFEAEKGVRQAFGSYGGKRFLAHKIASYIPYHKTYVEPFAGGAAVFYAKDFSPQEILNDKDTEIAFMHRFIRDHTPEDRVALEKREWVIRKDVHERLKTIKAKDDRERFYKAYYLTRSSYGKMRGRSFNPANEGVRIDFPANVERAQERIRKVTVHNKDYRKVLKKYDGPETFFYIDPPYPGTFNLFDFGFDENQFLKALTGLKAKWIVSYPAERASAFKGAGYQIEKVKRRNQMKGPGGNQEWIEELLVSNFPLEPVHLYIKKEFEPRPGLLEGEAPPFLPQLDPDPDLEKIRGAFKSPGGKIRLYKKIISFIPEHKTFVEGFCGGAQVFFHKKRSDAEVMNDVNSDLIAAYRFIKGMTPEDLAWLKEQNWVISLARARKLFESEPSSPRERFYRFCYLNKSTYWGRTDVWESIRMRGSSGQGAQIRVVDRLPEIQDRLKGVKLTSWDWKDVIKEFDSKDTFFYLDPPYPLHWPKERGGHGSKFFTEDELVPTLERIKGRFLVSYELEKAALFKGFKTYRVKTLWTGMHQMGARNKFELLVSNFALEPSDLYSDQQRPFRRKMTPL
jgi:site-specific DNA-adenine methylase